MTKRVECQVEIAPGCRRGVYANAFRIGGHGEERTLDFFLYSDVEDVASLVSRVTVHREILPELQASLGDVLRDLSFSFTSDPPLVLN